MLGFGVLGWGMNRFGFTVAPLLIGFIPGPLVEIGLRQAVLTLPKGASRTLDEGKRVALVRMTADDGSVGWGEAGPSRRWSAETLESCVTSLRHYLAPAVIGHDLFDIAGLHDRMNREIAPGLDPGQPIAKNAIDIAAHDLICRKLRIPLQSWLGAKRQNHVHLARLVSAATPEDAERIVREALAEGEGRQRPAPRRRDHARHRGGGRGLGRGDLA